MRINSSGSARPTARPDNRTEDQRLGALQKELRAASQALQALAGEEIPAKQKEVKGALLMAQMQMIQAQIDAILKEQAAAQVDAEATSVDAEDAARTPDGSIKKSSGSSIGHGVFVDTFA